MKRRKLNEPKERNPAHLDLSSHKIYEDEQEQLDRLMKVLHKRRKIGTSHIRSFYGQDLLLTPYSRCSGRWNLCFRRYPGFSLVDGSVQIIKART